MCVFPLRLCVGFEQIASRRTSPYLFPFACGRSAGFGDFCGGITFNIRGIRGVGSVVCAMCRVFSTRKANKLRKANKQGADQAFVAHFFGSGSVTRVNFNLNSKLVTMMRLFCPPDK